MIFSYSQEKILSVSIPANVPYDIHCFIQHADVNVHCPAHAWFDNVCASLRLKRDVLLIDEDIKQWPVWSAHKFYQTGEGWLYLESRHLNKILMAYPKYSTDIVQLRLFLSLT